VKVHAGRALGSRAPFLLDVRVDLNEYDDVL
jgi:hypothetical protein